MALGLKPSQANSILDTLLATAFIKLHIGDPGAAGTANASSVTTRPAATFSAASGGSKALSSAVSWVNWAGSTETLTHWSVWDASTAGNFLLSGIFTLSKTVQAGDSVQDSTLTASLPVAA